MGMQSAKIGVLLAVAGVAALAGLAWAQTRTNVVFVDNTRAVPVEVWLAGVHHGSLRPGEVLRVEVDPGRYELVTRCQSVTTVGGFDVPADTAGLRAVYDLGGKPSYVVVRARYDDAGGGTDYLPIESGSPFVVLPSDVSAAGIDEPFPTTVNTSRSTATVTHLCRFDPATERVGCPGA